MKKELREIQQLARRYGLQMAFSSKHIKTMDGRITVCTTAATSGSCFNQYLREQDIQRYFKKKEALTVLQEIHERE